MLRRNGKLDRPQVVLELRQFARSKNCGSNSRLSCDPIQGDLRRGPVHLSGDIEDNFQNSPVLFGELCESRVPRFLYFLQAAIAPATASVALVLASEETTGQRTPGTDPNPELLRRGNVFTLNIAFDKGIFQLKGDQPFLTLCLRERLGESVVPDLAFADKIIQR